MKCITDDEFWKYVPPRDGRETSVRSYEHGCSADSGFTWRLRVNDDPDRDGVQWSLNDPDNSGWGDPKPPRWPPMDIPAADEHAALRAAERHVRKRVAPC